MRGHGSWALRKTGPMTQTGPDDAWLATELGRLVELAARSRDARGGFGWLDEHGGLLPDRPVQTWISCRMTYVLALAGMRGLGDTADLVDHGVAALRGPLRDDGYGGWWADAAPGPDARKGAYDQAFVLLALAAAAQSGHADAEALLDEAVAVFDRHFWEENLGAVRESRGADWSDDEPYRGANANMHTVEACLALARLRGPDPWVDRALRITTRLIHGIARDHDFLLPEHFDTAWRPLASYNREAPAHPFRPFGVTIGHLFEWARLGFQLATALGTSAPSYVREDAEALFSAAVRAGWAADGRPGFVYTVDWDRRPVVAERLHWVVCEAVGSAAALGAPELTDWWSYARDAFVTSDGSWRHELDPAGRPSATVWAGRPDVYHAFQAILLTREPLDSTLLPPR